MNLFKILTYLVVNNIYIFLGKQYSMERLLIQNTHHCPKTGQAVLTGENDQQTIKLKILYQYESSETK